jgi:hypothetical protein
VTIQQSPIETAAMVLKDAIEILPTESVLAVHFNADLMVVALTELRYQADRNAPGAMFRQHIQSIIIHLLGLAPTGYLASLDNGA